MVGRPRKEYTLEDISKKLIPEAKGFLYLPEPNARARFIVQERFNVLNNSEQLRNEMFNTLTDREYNDKLFTLAVDIEGRFTKDLPTPIKKKLEEVETLPTPPILRLSIANFVTDNNTIGEANSSDIIRNIYDKIKFINYLYKWAFATPEQGNNNFYSFYMVESLPIRAREYIKRDLINRTDALIAFDKDIKKLKNKSDIFTYIKPIVLKCIDNAISIATSTDVETTYETTGAVIEELKEILEEHLDTLEEIKNSLQALTLEDITEPRRPKPFDQQHQINNSKLAHSLQELTKEGESKNNTLYTGKKGTKTLPVIVSIYSDTENQKLKPLKLFDKIVLDGVSTLYHAEYKTFTTGTLIKAITGREPVRRTGLYDDIEESIAKLSSTKIELDVSSIYGKYKAVDFKTLTMKGDIIPCREYTLTLKNGIKTKCYQILDKPVVYEYASLIRQIQTVEANLLNVSTPDTKDTICLRYYLINRIENIKSSNYDNKNISLSSIIEKTNIYIPEDNTKKIYMKRLRDNISEMLDNWIKVDYIKSWSWIKNGRDIISIKLVI